MASEIINPVTASRSFNSGVLKESDLSNTARILFARTLTSGSDKASTNCGPYLPPITSDNFSSRSASCMRRASVPNLASRSLRAPGALRNSSCLTKSLISFIRLSLIFACSFAISTASRFSAIESARAVSTPNILPQKSSPSVAFLFAMISFAFTRGSGKSKERPLAFATSSNVFPYLL